MKRRPAPLLALVLIAACAHPAWAEALSDSVSGTAACPDPGAVTDRHLYGLWQATLEGEPGTVTLRLEKNPRHDESVSGTLERDGRRAQVAGDVDDGDFTLEESEDGQRIDAAWTGRVVEGACGKEIRGTWHHDARDLSRPFVLRKVPGWQ